MSRCGRISLCRLQRFCFPEEAAEKLSADLKNKGIETKIIEEDNNYKVISPVVNTKDEAIDQLNGIKDKEVEDVFIASF